MTLPRIEDLTDTQALLSVDFYEESTDEFSCIMHTAAPCEGHAFSIPAMLLPMLVHEYGEPDEFIGRIFLVEKGAKKADYARVHGALTCIAEDAQHPGVAEITRTIDMKHLNNAFSTLNACPQPYQL